MAKINPDMPNSFHIAVVGAHLTRLPLNSDLLSRGGQFVKPSRTSKNYRLYALAALVGGVQKPGLKRVNDANSQHIDVEVWSLPAAQVGSFLLTISHPLGIGSVELEDGTWCHGFICEPVGLEADGVVDITSFGGWRAYLASPESRGA